VRSGLWQDAAVSTAASTPPAETTAERYARFAVQEARGESAVYESWALGISSDPTVLALIDQLPPGRRQPYLVFAVSRLVGAPLGGYPEWRQFALANWESLRREALVRLTQTNEPGRCAALLPALALIPGPLALLEVGASAGLCLYPDRYSYRYDGGDWLHPTDGPSTVLLECETSGGMPVPTRLPEIVWRAGIDLAPLDVRSEADSRWLETLIWPEQPDRLARIRAAADIARQDPPLLAAGDAADALAGLAAQAPPGATLVVVSSGVLVYVARPRRELFAAEVAKLETRWVALEAAGLFPSVAEGITRSTGLESSDLASRFALSLDGEALALVQPHGRRVDWL
jgi:hypothetical protein